MIHNHLHAALTTDESSLQEFYTHYLLKLYLFVERAYVIFEIVGLPLEYRGRHFDVFKRVHKWANFIKHPKSFLLVHHAQYFMDGDTPADESFDRTCFSVVIDQAFVSEYYAGSEKNAKLHSLLTNKKDVAVLFPNVMVMTEEFCTALHAFVDLIRSNQVYREVLASKSTYDAYFDGSANAGEQSTGND